MYSINLQAKLLDQMDEEFGVGNLVKEDVQNELKNAYTDKDLRGLKVEHSLVSYIYNKTKEMFYFYNYRKVNTS